MSWLSKTVDKVRTSVDKIGDKSTEALPKSWRSGGRKAFRYGAASMGGGMALQYEYSRNKGMNSDEATKNSVSGGMQYSEARTAQKTRVAEDKADAVAEQQRIQESQARDKARGQIAARVRRAVAGGRPSNKNGTVLSGGLGTTGSGGGVFAAMLGL